ncbi:MAG: hypothetical protein ACK5MU_01640 [Candidatus Saccharimonadales bacterium]
MDKVKQAEVTRGIRQLMNKSASETKQCYFIGCDMRTIHAHSISNKRLPLKLSKDGKVGFIKKIESLEYAELDETGRGQATTFSGFCEEHDKVFHPIDNADYEVGNTEQEFLFAMRASAKEFNAKQSDYATADKLIERQEFAGIRLGRDELSDLKIFTLGLRQCVKDLREDRGIFVDCFNGSKYNVLQTKVIVADEELPMAVSSCFHPELAPDGTLLNDVSSTGWGTKMKTWFLTVFPQNGKTFCVISYLRRHRRDFVFLDSIINADEKRKK